MLLLLGMFEVFEEIGVEDGGGDFVLAGSPLAEVDGAAAVGAEGDIEGVEGDWLAADGAVEDFGHGRNDLIMEERVEFQEGLLRNLPKRAASSS